MRPRALALSLAGCAAVLIGSVEIGQSIAQPLEQASAASTGTATSGTGSSSPSATSDSTPSSSASSTPSASSSASASKSASTGVTGTYTGATEETRFGPMQVEIVVKNGKITDVKALQLTDQDPRSVQISEYAAPILRQEALSAQSASIDSVSGATYTSDGYIQSLQSALDKAGLKS